MTLPCSRYVRTALACTMLAALPLASPVLAQSAAPQGAIAAQLAEAKATYEKAKQRQADAQKTYQTEYDAVIAAQSAYEQSLAAAKELLLGLQEDSEEAKVNLANATRQRKLSERNLELVKNDPKSDAADIAEAEKQLATARSIETGYADSVKNFAELAKKPPVTTATIAKRKQLDSALARKDQAAAILTDREEDLTAAFDTYSSLLLQNPPPYLKEIEISSSRGVLYHAQWEAGAGPKLSAEERLTLINEKQKIKAVLAELDAELKRNSEHRASLAELTHKDAVRLVELAQTIQSNQEWQAFVNGGIFFASTLVDVFSTGGANTLGEVGFDRILANTLTTEVPKGNRNAVVYLSSLALPESKASPANALPGAAPDSRLVTAGKIVAGDSFEKVVAAAAPDADDYLKFWSTLKSNGWKLKSNLIPTNFNKQKFATALKSGLPKPLLEAALKFVFDQYFNGQIDVARQDYMRLLMNTQSDAAIIARSLQLDREKIDHRRALRVALADLDYRLKMGGTTLKLNRLVDKAATQADLDDGSLRARLVFNQDLSAPPIIRVGDAVLLTVQRNSGAGSEWLASGPSSGKGSLADSLPVLVGTGSGNTPFGQLDGKPETVAQLDFKASVWNKLESAGDLSHRVRYQQAEYDLTGFWKDEKGRLIYVNQTGSRISGRHINRDPAFAHNAGASAMVGQIDGDIATGQMITRLPRAAHKKCPIDVPATFRFTVTADKLAMAGNQQARSVATSDNCRISNQGAKTVRWTRVVDDTGQPKK